MPNRKIHDNIVSARATQLKNLQYQVKADIPGFDPPDLINGYKPDIFAYKQSTLLSPIESIVISEIETSDSYSSEHTLGQLRAFRKYPRAKLEVVVPKTVLPLAKATIGLIWQIPVDNWMQYEE